METMYSPSKGWKYEHLIVTSLVTISAIGGVIFIALLGSSIVEETSNLELWLYLLGAVGFTIWMSLWARQSWRKIIYGIVVREGVLSIFGYDIPWEDVMEVYANPGLHYVSIRLSKPYGISRIKTVYIRKETISEWSSFLGDLERHDINIKQENLS